ncbi:MAG: class I SAM-dependent methyltransferase [Verrucomicrobiae bacterium]|nr:class I SAM-dependent methyltransferase [Verrucomicrobiae bacterium]
MADRLFPAHHAHSPCPFCDSHDGLLLTRVDNFFRPQITHLCTSCGTAYTDPLPSAEAFMQYHQTTYRKQYKGRPEAAFRLRRIASVNQKRFQFILNTLPLPASGSMLDVGCGYGYLVEAFAARGWKALGFDPDAKAINTAQARLKNLAHQAKLHVASIHDSPIQSGACNLVTAFHVLEHLPNPLQALQRCYEWLAPGGYIVIEVPNLITLSHSFHSRFHRAHIVHFHPEALSQALRHIGFEALQIYTQPSDSTIRINARKPLDPFSESRHNPITFTVSAEKIQQVISTLSLIRKKQRFTSRSPHKWIQVLVRSILVRLKEHH